MVGRDVFTQTGGIHADGDAKGDLYANRLLPARFGRRRRYALGKMAGKASLEQNLQGARASSCRPSSATWCCAASSSWATRSTASPPRTCRS